MKCILKRINDLNNIEEYLKKLENLKKTQNDKNISDIFLVKKFLRYYDVILDDLDFHFIIRQALGSNYFTTKEMKTRIPVCLDELHQNHNDQKYGLIKIKIAFKKGKNIDVRNTYSFSRVKTLIENKKILFLDYGEIYRNIDVKDLLKYSKDIHLTPLSTFSKINENNFSECLNDDNGKIIMEYIASYFRKINIDKNILELLKKLKNNISNLDNNCEKEIGNYQNYMNDHKKMVKR